MKRLFWAAALALVPVPALAHVGLSHVTGFANGFLHPLSGIDHLLAMTAVGIVAAARGKRTLWLIPAIFLSIMTLGASLGMQGISLPFSEVAIALSLIAFGTLCMMRGSRDLSFAALALVVGGFALFHGYAHGVEMPETFSGLTYGLGFLVGTALLHSIGIVFGLLLQKRSLMGIPATSLMGGAIAITGVALVTGGLLTSLVSL